MSRDIKDTMHVSFSFFSFLKCLFSGIPFIKLPAKYTFYNSEAK